MGNEAAAARHDHWIAVDRNYRIMLAGADQGTGSDHVGEILWDAYPGSQDLYEDLYRHAWQCGHATARQFHRGHLVDVHAERTGDRLLISYRLLVELETVTLEALSRSLDRILDRLDAGGPGCGRASGAPRPPLQPA